jgi:formamidopyrimidine-DNA glycosylase
MPELPEVETVVRGLKKTVVDKQIKKIDVFHPKPLVNTNPVSFNRFLQNEVIRDIRRWGKYIIFEFKSQKHLVVHLRMTGKFIFLPDLTLGKSNQSNVRKHIRLHMQFKDKSYLLYQDIRIFGTFKTYATGEPLSEYHKIGPDPFSSQFTPEWLSEKLRNRHLAIKVLLLDQKIISGLGNIYVCEALHKAGINPFLPGYCLNKYQVALLISAIREILKQAIEYGGTTISDFSHIDEHSGQFQQWLKVYQKKGQLCTHCNHAIIVSEKQAQRSTFYCPTCQPADKQTVNA